MDYVPLIRASTLLILLALGGTATAGERVQAPSPSSDTVIMQGDKNRDGFISRDEADPKMLEHWTHWDSNGDGKIDAGEYAIGIQAARTKDRRP